MVTVMLDEIATATVENLHLPMPADRRLRDLVEQALKTPSVRGTMEVWAERVCVSAYLGPDGGTRDRRELWSLASATHSHARG
jgi:hypothetical protein